MKKYLNFIITIFLIILQVTLFSRMKILGINVNLSLISVIVVASFAESKISIPNAIIAGILYDVYACYDVGWNLVMFSAIALIMMLVVKFMYKGSVVTTVVFTAIFTVVTELIFYWLSYLSNGNVYNSWIIVKVVLPQALINSICSFFLFYVYKKVNKEKSKYRY